MRAQTAGDVIKAATDQMCVDRQRRVARRVAEDGGDVDDGRTGLDHDARRCVPEVVHAKPGQPTGCGLLRPLAVATAVRAAPWLVTTGREDECHRIDP